jgi:uncharacterized membrane protein YccF (DUF307 family)
MKFLANIIWIVFGGWAIALEYIIAGLGMCATIIGIPFGIQCFKLAMVGFAPFGHEIEQQQSGGISFLLNIIWFFVGGIWICLTHLFLGVLFCITVVGLPFGLQHFKLSMLALSPFGKKLG